MNLADRLLQQSAETPNAPALVFRDQTISYAELAGQVLSAAGGLVSAGVRHGDRVVLIMRNCPEFVVAYLGLARIGAVAVPVNPAATPREMAIFLQSSGPVGVIAQEKFLAPVREAVDACRQVRFVSVTDPGDNSKGAVPFRHFLTAAHTRELPAGPTRDDLATLLFTSGVTGLSKAVMLTHWNLISDALGSVDVMKPGPGDRILAVLPMFHSFGWTVSVLAALLSGACCVVVESVQPFSELVAAIEKQNVTMLIAVPAIHAALLKAPGFRPESLKWGLSGASPLPPGIHELYQSRLGVPLIEGYGLTETSPVLTINPIDGANKPGSVGLPIEGVDLAIKAPDGAFLPSGEIGEVLAKGPNVMKGYWRDPASTAAAFTQDGWLLTGDLGYLDRDGYLFLVDRAKDLVIVKGLNVYPREVEEILMQHPAVAEAAVIGVPEATGDEWVRAYVVLKENTSATSSELSAHCRGRLAGFKIPRTVTVLDTMPRNSLGKTLKRTLREMAMNETRPR